MLRLLDMIITSEKSGRVVDIDYMIELSILKVRRMQIAGVRDELQRLLVIETLQSNIERKISQLEDEDTLTMDRSAVFISILHEAIRRLGLTKLVRFGINLPENDDQLPRLKLPSIRKSRDLPTLTLNVSQNTLSEVAACNAE